MSHHRTQIAVPRDGKTTFQILVNAFAVTSLQTHVSYHYNVAFPKVHTAKGERDIPERFKWELFERLQDQAQIRPRMLFDGVINAFGLVELPQQETTYEVVIEGRARPYPITLARVAIIQPDALSRFLKGQEPATPEVLSARMLMHVMLRAHARANRSYSQTRNAFYVDRGQQHMVGSFELWKGIFQSVKPGQGILYVNIDSTIACMYMRGSVVDALCLLLGKTNIRDLHHLTPSERRKVERFLQSLRVEIIHRRPRAIRSIAGIEWMSARDYSFDTEAGRTNVADYFLQLLSRPLQLPDLPLLARFGKTAAIPLELLEILPGQLYRGPTPDAVKQKMIQLSGDVKPPARFQEVESAFNLLGYATSDYIRDSGVVIQPDLIRTDARLLPHPTLEYANAGDQVPSNGYRDDGAWDIMRRRFRDPKTIRAWAIVIVRERGRPIEGLQAGVKELRTCLIARGLKIEVDPYVNENANADNLKQELTTAVFRAWEKYPNTKPPTPNVSFVLVVIPESKDLRIAIKQWGDVEKGIVTQIVRGSKLQDARNQYCNNLALKINIKLGGTNSTFTSVGSILRPGTMVVGIDTSHPPPGVKHLPTVAGFVFSLDPKATRYRAITDVQAARQELIPDVGQKLKEAIMAFRSVNGDKFPTGVLVYRDGVSEGEYAAVTEVELGGMKAMLREIGTEIPITFVIVTKRHHVKFLPADRNNRDKTGNTPTGTLVESTVVAPNFPNFYLVGQGGLKGTSCPAHYSVLADGVGFNLQRLQEVSYAMCHIQQRATRVISLPAPLYYADLVAARGLFHLDHAEQDDNDTERSIESFKSMFRPIHPNLQLKMYWV